MYACFWFIEGNFARYLVACHCNFYCIFSALTSMHGEFVRFFRVFYKRFINILKVHIFCSHINIFSELFSALKLWISLRIGFQRGFFRLQCKSSIQVAQASNSLERDGFFFKDHTRYALCIHCIQCTILYIVHVMEERVIFSVLLWISFFVCFFFDAIEQFNLNCTWTGTGTELVYFNCGFDWSVLI